MTIDELSRLVKEHGGTHWFTYTSGRDVPSYHMCTDVPEEKQDSFERTIFELIDIDEIHFMGGKDI